MTETVDVIVQVPVDDLRKWMKRCERYRDIYERCLSSALGIRLDARFCLALLDTSLPPEPLRVGDRVTHPDVDGVGTLIGFSVHNTAEAAVDWPHGIEVHLDADRLARVEGD